MSEKMSASDRMFYLHDAVGILHQNGTQDHADACKWAVERIEALRREVDEAREQVAARDKIIDQLRASHAEEAREWDEHRTAYINDCVRLARAAGFELDDAPEAIADLIVRKRRDSQREADGLREALAVHEKRTAFMRKISPHVAAMLDEYDAPVAAVLSEGCGSPQDRSSEDK